MAPFEILLRTGIGCSGGRARRAGRSADPCGAVLLGVGALSRNGKMIRLVALGIAVVASLPPDLIWYELGRAGHDY